jgi:hypothetical protein
MAGAPRPGSTLDAMKDVWIAAAGFALGWLVSKTWNDPGCQAGLVVFALATAAMGLAFALAVVGHGRPPAPAEPEEDDEDEGRR